MTIVGIYLLHKYTDIYVNLELYWFVFKISIIHLDVHVPQNMSL